MRVPTQINIKFEDCLKSMVIIHEYGANFSDVLTPQILYMHYYDSERGQHGAHTLYASIMRYVMLLFS